MPGRPKIRGTQIGFQRPAQIDTIKAAMRDGTFAFGEERARLDGIVDSRGVYHITDGHHRMAAALELERETGDSMPVLQLLTLGRWVQREGPPINSRPLSSRHWWGRFWNWVWP